MQGHRKKCRLLIGRADRDAECRADRNTFRMPPLEFPTTCFPSDDDSLVRKPASSGYNAATAEGVGEARPCPLSCLKRISPTSSWRRPRSHPCLQLLYLQRALAVGLLAQLHHTAAYRKAQVKLAAKCFCAPAGAGAAVQLGATQATEATMPAQVQHQQQDCIPTSQPAVLSPTTAAASASAIAAIPNGMTFQCLMPSV